MGIFKRKKSFEGYLASMSNKQYEYIKKYTVPKAELCGVLLEDITYLPYDVLKHDVPDLLKELKFEQAIYEVVRHKDSKITIKDIIKAKNPHKLSFVLWLKIQYDTINQIENKYLSSHPEPKLIAAGIRDLDVLEDINVIDQLAGGDILKWQAIRQLPYNDIFNKQLKNVLENKINKKLIEINNAK